MAITLENTPLALYLSRNQCAFQFNCADVINTAEVKERRFSIISSAIGQDDTLAITWSHDSIDYVVDFTFKTSPNADLFEIITSASASSAEEYVINSLIPGLLSHPDIAEFFDVSLEEDTFFGFRLTSRVAGPISLAFAAVGFTSTEAGTVGVAEIRETDYLASAWIYMANAQDSDLRDFTKIGEVELYPAADNLADIDVGEILDSFFTDPETPTATNNAPVICAAIKRDFFVLFGQKFGNPLARKKQSRTPILRVIKGGMRHAEFIAAAGKINFNTTGWRVLTLRTRREVAETQSDWIFIHAGPAEVATASLNYQLFFTDGTSATGQLWSGKTLAAGNTYQMAAGYTHAGLKGIANGAGKIGYKYTLQVGGVSGASALSEKITFYVMPEDALATVMQYENTLGAIESWRFIGNRSLGGSKSSQQYRRPLQNLAGAEFQELLSFNEQDTPQITFSTGPMSQSDALAFRDFLRSRHKWLLADGDYRIPFRIADTNYQLDGENMDADYTRNFEFTAILAPSKGVSSANEPWQ
jgi:hypothetical protein